MTRYRSERDTDQEEMETSNDGIQTSKIYRPGGDEDAMTRYRPEGYTDQEEMETSNGGQRRDTDQEDTQSRNRCRRNTERNE